MKKDDVLKFLRSVLGPYACHPALIDELLALIAGKGIEPRFFAILTRQLAILTSAGVLATRYKEFEPLGKGLYSMHLVGPGFNIRIIYGFLPSRQPTLLLAFYEREGKSKTDYTPYLQPASTRLASMKGA